MPTVTTSDGIEVTSNSESLEAMQQAFDIEPSPPPEPEPPKEPPPSKEPTTLARAADGTFAKPDEKRRARHDPQARIQEAIAKQREAERRAEEAERRAAERESEAQRLRTEPPKPIATQERVHTETPTQIFERYMRLPDAPQRTQYQNDNEFAAAVSLHVQDKRYEERRAQEREADQREAARLWEAEKQRNFQQRLNEAEEKKPGLKERLRTAGASIPLNAPAFDYITTSPVGPDVLEYLLDHPSDAQRLSALPPLPAREAIAEIAGELKAHSVAAQATTGPARNAKSNAKPPIPPVGGSPVGSAEDVLEEDLPTDEFIRRGNKRDGIRIPTRR